ncbi:hypothetical protein AAFF_G00300460 [Aldrovandia affinis]|uniref:Uncharacterized protein n=1 Tax=Aldrovandia affinis TaxID=143900 RepID=A0AAD7SPK9_9TELE|nr:hypothetical protein AAFF_G00300460 [Aldrovandia affinis]
MPQSRACGCVTWGPRPRLYGSAPDHRSAVTDTQCPEEGPLWSGGELEKPHRSLSIARLKWGGGCIYTGAARFKGTASVPDAGRQCAGRTRTYTLRAFRRIVCCQILPPSSCLSPTICNKCAPVKQDHMAHELAINTAPSSP